MTTMEAQELLMFILGDLEAKLITLNTTLLKQFGMLDIDLK